MRNGLNSTIVFDCPKRLYWRLFCACPLWLSRGIQLLLKEELSSVPFLRGVTWGSCKVASVTSKDSV